MKKILFLIALAFAAFISNAQVFETKGTFIVTEPKEGLKVKDCFVCIEEQYVEFLLFDKDVVVPIVEKKHVNTNGVCGEAVYLDDERMSYIFYGYGEETKMCMVSLICLGDRWTFVRIEHE